jgi:hypothetical protein
MNFRERLFVNLKASNFKMFILMTVFYGFIFGGITQIDSAIDGRMDVKGFIVSIIATTIAYGLMFMMVMLIIYNSQSIKMFMTLGMSRKNLVRCWRDLHIYYVLIGIIGASVILTLVQLEDSTYLSYRLLDIDFNHPGVFGFSKYLFTLTLMFGVIMGIINVIAQVGNHLGWRWVFNAAILLAGLLLFAVPPMIQVFAWGQGYLIMVLIMSVVAIGTFAMSYRMIGKMEVKR